jgi:hypothetical protein
VSPVKYELGFYIPGGDILHNHSRENLKSYKGNNNYGAGKFLQVSSRFEPVCTACRLAHRTNAIMEVGRRSPQYFAAAIGELSVAAGQTSRNTGPRYTELHWYGPHVGIDRSVALQQRHNSPSTQERPTQSKRVARRQGNTPTKLGLLERANLNHWTAHVNITTAIQTNKLSNTINSVAFSPREKYTD